jgi:protoporphyrinogen oxidase
MFTKNSRFSRRDFLIYGSLSVVGIVGAATAVKRILTGPTVSKFAGKIAGANAKIGHMMRMRKFPSVTSATTIDTIIVGGGIAGLSAAWWLEKNGKKDFLLLELDEKAGGNSQSGENSVSPYPWGAHYLPIPGEDALFVKQILEEFGVIKSFKNGLPVYDEYFLCADPNERLLFQGRWHEGLIPQNGVSEIEKSQYKAFFEKMKEYSATKGKDGKWAFTIPLDLSSEDEELRALDKLSMASFMEKAGWNSRHLKWYVDYCCKDDYGQTSEDVSAWAGIHYFASRSGKAANAGRENVLTWPEGNGWLVKKFEAKLSSFIRKNSLVFNIEKEHLDFYDITTKTSHRIQVKNVIYAAPRYTAKYSINPSMGELTLPSASFAPWVVANVTVKEKPEGKGHDLSWDNVSFYSKSLGYIVATHQGLSHSKKETVLTYYLPLTDEAPEISRIKAFQKDHAHWAEVVSEDLEKMHPGISSQITNLEVWVWGHGMVSPGVDYLWSKNRQDVKKSLGHIHFAHSEMSGISIFEEAQYQGIMAAKKILGKDS